MSVQQSITQPTGIIDLGVPALNSTSGARYFLVDGVQCVGKFYDGKYKFAIANEIIAFHIAQKIGLNIPHCEVRKHNGQNYFFSTCLEGADKLSETTERRDPMKKVLARPEDLIKILCFDIFILNRDRHMGNLMLTGTAGQRNIHIYDHDCALLNRGEDTSHLKMKHESECSHFLTPSFYPLVKQIVNSESDFDPCVNGIKSITDGELDSIMNIAVGNNLLGGDVSIYVLEVLKERRDNFGGHVKNLFLRGKL